MNPLGLIAEEDLELVLDAYGYLWIFMDDPEQSHLLGLKA